MKDLQEYLVSAILALLLIAITYQFFAGILVKMIENAFAQLP